MRKKCDCFFFALIHLFQLCEIANHSAIMNSHENCRICDDQMCHMCPDVCIFCQKLKCKECICNCDAVCETCGQKYDCKMIYSCQTCHDNICDCSELTCVHKRFTCCRCKSGHPKSNLTVCGLHGI